MADPRLAVSYDGIGALYMTFKHDTSIVYSATVNGGSSQVGLAVKLVSADTVALTTAASVVLGKLIKVESDGIATVQVKGCCTLPMGTGHTGVKTAVVGGKFIGDVSTAAEGYICGPTNNAWNADILMARGVILDLGTLTAVEVYLG